MKTDEEFVSAVWCMDGRVKRSIATYAGDAYVDSVCEGPGTVGILADKSHEDHSAFIEKMKVQLTVSYTKHNSRTVFVDGHAECAGHPVPDNQHKADVLKAAEAVCEVISELGFDDMKVISTWSERNADGVWESVELS